MTLPINTIICGDCLEVMRTWPEKSINCCVTSPPYWGLRDYGVDGQIGLEATPEEFIAKMVEVFAEVRRVLRDDGTLWLNLGDSYNNFRSQMGPGQAVHGRDKLNGKPDVKSKTRGVHTLKEKDLCGIPWRVALALQADGWYLRQDIIWHKPNPMPESVTDRCTKAHEYIFLLTKKPRYYYDADVIKEPCESANPDSNSYRANGKSDSRKKHAIYCKECNGSGDGIDGESGTECEACGGTGLANIGKAKTAVKNEGFWIPSESGRNKRSVWTVSTKPYREAHFATFPPDLIDPCILAGCPKGGVVLDPFMGSGTVAEVAIKNGRNYVGTELSQDYMQFNHERTQAAETGIPVKEARKGQMALFGKD